MERGSLAAVERGSGRGEGTSGRPVQGSSEAPACPEWRKLLAGTPREVLGRLVQDDPLRVREVVASRLQAEALLLDADRAHLRALARIARFAGRYRGRPDLRDWIESAAAEAVHELVREDHESARRSRPSGAASEDVFASLASPLGLDADAMRAACAAFNVLPLADRSAFFGLVLRARSLDDLAREYGESATEVARRARRALDAVLESGLAEAGPGGGS